MFSLKQQISRILIITIIILSLLMMTLLFVMIRNYQNHSNRRRMEDLTVYAETLNDSILQVNNITGIIYSSNKSFDGLSLFNPESKKYDYIYDLYNQLRIQVKSNQNLSGLFVFYDNGDKKLYFVGEDMTFKEKEVLKQYGKGFVNNITQNYKSEVIKTQKDVHYNVFLKKGMATIMGTIQLSKGLPIITDSTASYGVIFEDNFYRTLGEKEELTQEECTLLEQGKNTIGDRIIYVKNLDGSKMSVVEVLPKSPWLYFRKIHLLLGMFMIFLVYLLFRMYQFIYIQISRPLEDMTRALGQIQGGVWEVEFNANNRITEIENVRQTVRLMLKEIEEYKIRNYEEKLEKQKTKLQYLQLQLAPHFYMNCLKNAYYMLILKEYDNVEQFLLRLSTHLRYLLQKDGVSVTVQKEKEFVENYLNLQNLISDHPIRYEISVEEELLGEEIPILSIQTFVENSVKYSRESGEDNLKIQIKVQSLKTEEEDYIDITVKDNGTGYPEDVLSMLNKKTPSQKGSLGVGIVNLLSRVKIHHGKEAKWYFINDKGAYSELLLPMKKGEQSEYLNC